MVDWGREEQELQSFQMKVHRITGAGGGGGWSY